MAIISKIRDKSVLIVIIIGIALLAFILGDWKFISGGGGPQYGIGTVDGEMVDQELFAMASENFQNQDQQQALQNQREYGQKEREASQTKAFNYTVESTILKKEFEALGIRVSDNEFEGYFYGDTTQGFTILPDLKQSFTDSTGRFNDKALRQRVEQMQNSEKPEERKSWEDSKKYYVEQREREKYFTIINQGAYVTKLEAKDEYMAKGTTKDIQYIFRSYSEIPDEKIKVTDSDMEAFYDEHKDEARFKLKSNDRVLRYFDIAIQPSQEDTNNFNSKTSTLVSSFRNAKNDSVFVMRNSENPVYMPGAGGTSVPQGDKNAQGRSTYPPNMDTVFKTASIGQVVGPYNDNGVMKISKVTGFTPRSITARHILLNVAQGDAEADKRQKAKADSLLAIINKDNFEELALKHSDDPGSKVQGGKIEDFLEATMVQEFGSYTANQPIGKIDVVKSYFGYHIIEVLERSNDKYPILASVQLSLKPTQTTLESRQQTADDLLYSIDEKLSNKKEGKEKVALFDTIAKKEGYLVRPLNLSDKNPAIYGFVTPNAEDKMFQLAYAEDVEVGQLIGAPAIDKDRYIIAIVSQIKDMEEPKWQDFEEYLKFEVTRKKKADRFIKEIGSTTDLNTLAKKYNVNVTDANISFANPQFQGAGYEPEVVGALFSGLKDGQTTKPIMGKNGVYVVKIKKTNKAPSIANYTAQQDELLQTKKSAMGNEIIAALKEKYNVIDNRRFARLGIRN